MTGATEEAGFIIRAFREKIIEDTVFLKVHKSVV